MTVSHVIGHGIAVAVFVSFVFACSRPDESAASSTTESAPAVGPRASEGASTHTVTGKAPAAVNGISSVVMLTPRPPKEFPPPAEKPSMDQISLTFTPAVLFVRTGQATEFRNSDDVLHNVRVREETTRQGLFNVAIITGGTYLHTFERDGFYDVGCDIHPGMSAQIIASSSPYALMADTEGNFVFENVEPGAYTVTIYSGTDKVDRLIEVSGPRTDIGL